MIGMARESEHRERALREHFRLMVVWAWLHGVTGLGRPAIRFDYWRATGSSQRLAKGARWRDSRR